MARVGGGCSGAGGVEPAWRGLAAVLVLVAGGFSQGAGGAEIHRCPQPDGTTRFQDRPCGPATAGANVARGSERGVADVPAADAARRDGKAQSANRTVEPRTASTTSGPAPTASGPPESRADYLARTAERCRDGDGRACAAVTCEKSGRLDSPACQEAVGYLRGAGWDLRPRSDLFDPARTTDEFTLTCRATGRRATLTRARGADTYAGLPAAATRGGAPAVSRTGLPAAAREFCATSP